MTSARRSRSSPGCTAATSTSELPDDPGSAVRLCTPLLDALEIPWRLVEGPDDADVIEAELAAAFDEERASAVLLGAPTT